MSNQLQKANQAKIDAFLDGLVRDNGKVMTRRDFFNSRGIGKKQFTETHAKQKRNGAYAKLSQPRTEYYMVMQDGREQWLYKVPKIVWDDCIFVDLTA